MCEKDEPGSGVIDVLQSVLWSTSGRDSESLGGRDASDGRLYFAKSVALLERNHFPLGICAQCFDLRYGLRV